ncbi:fatty acyl-AMP ligase [Rhodococcus sp. X156]|uniref:fatty acyl-AMP ligase n=1 Tax=Rhodococcus sp. X156 TaxID=2499145 RepID=UPI000FDABE8C|nr:fatty acyl-AMP ligase [Rhodococcus sp. X156]
MSTFTETLYRTAATSPNGMVTGEPDAPLRRSWGEIHALARKGAGALAAAGVGPGDAVTILAGESVEIAPAIQSAWMRGASVTMLHQPTPRTDLGVWAEETMTVLDMVGASVVLLGEPFGAIKPLLEERKVAVVEMADLVTGPDTDPLEVDEDATALLQLTSGSTGTPKGVRITHRNLNANILGMAKGANFDYGNDVMVSWLPLFHDMGMVGFLTVPMTLGVDLISITPMDFLRSPLLWLELISRYKGTITAAPNFAYAVVAKRLAKEEDGKYDLSSMRFALNGAEPIDPAAAFSFLEAGARFGLRSSAMVPAYGMAESTLAISFHPLDTDLIVDTVDTDALERDRVAKPATGENTRGFPSLGLPLEGIEVRTVDPEGNVLPTRGVGVLQLRGEPITPGYLTVDGPQDIRDDEGWLDTGDEGYVTEDGHVVVCGRVKDVIIMGGRNIYPTDIERAAATVAGVRAGNVVAVRMEAGERRESFAVVLESNQHADEAQVERIRKEVTAAVVSATGVRPRNVTVLAPGSVPKTPSGKLRRSTSVALVS